MRYRSGGESGAGGDGEKSRECKYYIYFSLTSLKSLVRTCDDDGYLNGKKTDAGHVQHARALAQHNINTMVYYIRFFRSFDSRPENAGRIIYIIAVSDV